jgi:hypothetical protein
LSLFQQITAIIETFEEGKIAEIECSEGYKIKLITVKWLLLALLIMME